MIYTCTLNPSVDYVVTAQQIELGKLNRATKRHISGRKRN